MGTSQITQAKSIGFSPHLDDQAPFLKTTPIQLIEHGKIKPVPSDNRCSSVLVSLVQEGTLHTISEETETPIQLQTFNL